MCTKKPTYLFQQFTCFKLSVKVAVCTHMFSFASILHQAVQIIITKDALKALLTIMYAIDISRPYSSRSSKIRQALNKKWNHMFKIAGCN